MILSAAASQALRQAYLELFLLAGALLDGRVTTPQVASVRLQAEGMLKRYRQELLMAGIPESWVHDVQLPVVGLVDEAARRSPVSGLAEGWKSLQFPLYGHEEVGITAFDRLDALRKRPDTPLEVLEVYALCLSAGFQGRYAPDRLEDLAIVQEGLRNELTRRQRDLPPLAPGLTPAASGQWTPSQLEPRWIALIAGTLIVLVTLGVTVSVWLKAGRVERLLQPLTLEPSERGAAPRNGAP